MKIKELEMAGCYLIQPNISDDNRGIFVKTLHKNLYEEFGIKSSFEEEYYSISHYGVVRGMHFQVPPKGHMKLVYCPKGAIFDAIVDIRKQSSTFKKNITIELNEKNKSILVLPTGIAHGFSSLVDGSIMIYKTSTVYDKAYDTGIHWDSCGIEWPSSCNPKLISERDKMLTPLRSFKTPFIL